MYQTEGMMDTPLNPPILGGFTLPTATIETEGIKGPKFKNPNMPMPKPGNVMDTAARGITPAPPVPPFAQPSLYETYTKAGVNIPTEFSESSDEEIKDMFESMYRQKIMKKGGIKYKQKGLKGDHSINGSKIAKSLCPRLGLNNDETEIISWCVLNHLYLQSFYNLVEMHQV